MTIRDVVEVLIGILTMTGSVAGAFFGAKISIARLEVRMTQAEAFILELREMKHLKVDAYIPRAVDDMEARIKKLEHK